MPRLRVHLFSYVRIIDFLFLFNFLRAIAGFEREEEGVVRFDNSNHLSMWK